MTENREIIRHPRQQGQGPHRALPVGFMPLRLCVEQQALQIDVITPVATVGRCSDADVRLGYPDVSRRHCQFVFENGQWRVYDLRSLNGVYVNQQPIANATLFAGDQVRVGSVTFLILSATPAPDEEKRKHEKLRQIAKVLPADDER
jgi:hypothetical protein